MPIHYLLKAARRESGYSLREAASRLSLPPSTLYRYEEGLIRKIPPERAAAMLDFYLPFLIRLSDRLTAQEVQEGRRNLPVEKQTVTPDLLYSYYWAADERGRRTILRFLQLQSQWPLEEDNSKG